MQILKPNPDLAWMQSFPAGNLNDMHPFYIRRAHSSHVHIHHYRKKLGHGSAGEKAAIASPKCRYRRLSKFCEWMLAAISISHLIPHLDHGGVEHQL